MYTDRLVFKVRISKDKMAVFLDAVLPKGDPTPMAEAIHEELLVLGIPEPPSVDLIKAMLYRAAERSAQAKRLVIMKGTPSEPPVDGRIEWAGDFFNTGFVVDPITGTINYRQRAAQVSVAEGQLLAKVIPPKDGRDGVNVLGRVIPAAKPQKRRIRVGNNVRFDREEGAFYATASGRIRWVNNLLFVDPVYDVSGSVGLETGNICHPGALTVEEDVLDDAWVETGGDIEVKGVVGGADVRTSGNLTVRGGIIRSLGHKIEVKGSVHAKFIIDAHVEAGGDVVVEREIVNSCVSAGGRVLMPKGRIVGGRIFAARGVDAGQVGSPASVPTEIFLAGAEAIRTKQKEMQDASDALDEVFHRLHDLSLPPVTQVTRLPEDQVLLVRRLLEEASDLEAFIHERARELEALRSPLKEKKPPVLEVKKTLYTSCTVYMDLAEFVSREVYTGPHRIHCQDGEILIEQG